MRGESGQHSSIQPRAGVVSPTAFNLTHSTLDWTQGEDGGVGEEEEGKGSVSSPGAVTLSGRCEVLLE